MIPKVIHYCWFGGKRKPKLVRECISSWKKILPEYKIVEWNETNSDLTHPFVKFAYSKKKWAFVADYVRLNVLSIHGGIYLDTDMIVLKSLNDLLDNKCFFGAEDLKFISCGIIGCVPNFKFIDECRVRYDEIIFDENFNSFTIPKIISKQFREYNSFNGDFAEIIELNEIKIFPKLYFYSMSIDKKDNNRNYNIYIDNLSYAVHLWSSSWVEYSEFHLLKKGKYLKGFNVVLKTIRKNKKVELVYLKKVLFAFKKSLLW